MELEIKGKVSAVLPMMSGTTANGDWKRQVVVIEFEDGGYTRKVAIENAKKADEFAKLNVGDEGVFKCNIPTSREYNGRWYTSVTCWSWTIDSGADAPTPMPEPEPESVAAATPTAPSAEATTSDDMPF